MGSRKVALLDLSRHRKCLDRTAASVVEVANSFWVELVKPPQTRKKVADLCSARR